MIHAPNKKMSDEFNRLKLQSDVAGQVIALIDAAEESGKDRISVAKAIRDGAHSIQAPGTDSHPFEMVLKHGVIASAMEAGWLAGDVIAALVEVTDQIYLGESGTDPNE